MNDKELYDYIILFVERTGNCIKILDRVLPNMESMYKDELEHIRDELSQVTQIGILLKEKTDGQKDTEHPEGLSQ